MKQTLPKLKRNNNLVKEIVLCDGVGSSGKGMINHIISSFKRVELQRNDYVFDYIPKVHALGKISKDAAITILKTEADSFLYNNMISRGVNFRPTDSSSIYRNGDSKKYIKRLKLPEGNDVLIRIKKEKPIFTNAPHEALGNCNLFFEAFENRIKFIYVLRNPVEIIYDWLIRGFGDRIGKDPREFQLAFNYKNKPVPIFAKDFYKIYSKLTPVDRNIRMISYLHKDNLLSYKKLKPKYKKNVKILLFDDLVYKTDKCIPILENFLKTKKTLETAKILKIEKCPRPYNEKLEFMKQFIKKGNKDSETLKIFNKLNKYYSNNIAEFKI
jgi:hypothetical protein